MSLLRAVTWIHVILQSNAIFSFQFRPHLHSSGMIRVARCIRYWAAGTLVQCLLSGLHPRAVDVEQLHAVLFAHHYYYRCRVSTVGGNHARRSVPALTTPHALTTQRTIAPSRSAPQPMTGQSHRFSRGFSKRLSSLCCNGLMGFGWTGMAQTTG